MVRQMNDVPTFEEDLGPHFTEVLPVLAIEAAYERYLPSHLPFGEESQTEFIILTEKPLGRRYVVELVSLLKTPPARIEYV